MRVDLHDVAKGRKQRALPATSLSYETGRATLATAETEQRPTVLGLIASGRMRADTGTVTIDGRTDATAIRRSIALVDALDVSEPEPNIPVSGVVAEELMFAGLASDPFSTRRWIDEHGLSTLASTPIGNLAPDHRIRLLCELAVLRPGVAGFVLTSPDRHGGEPAVWWSIAQNFAARGFAVLVIAGRASQSVIVALEALEALEVEASRAPEAEATTEVDTEASEFRTITPISEDREEAVRDPDDSPKFGDATDSAVAAAVDAAAENDEPTDAAPPATQDPGPSTTHEEGPRS